MLEKIFSFENLYKAHKVARLGKRDKIEVIDFELNLSRNLTLLSQSLINKTYKMSGYYSFYVHDPKEREIYALHYVDRVVQHCLCDELLAPVIDKKLIYDNAACRVGKGTHFALDRVKKFINDFYKRQGAEGYFLKCDIRKFFNSIDHEILKKKIYSIGFSEDIMWLLNMIIDSFEVTPGKGIPMGNQTSQWFAIYYLDGFDRMIKEQLKIKYYSRYMDDCVLIHKNKDYLKNCKSELKYYLAKELKLEFNEKTQIFPIKNGVDYLGWHFYLTKTGKVIMKVRTQAKKRFKRKIKYIESAYANGNIELSDALQVINSYRAHLSHGNTFKLRNIVLNNIILKRII